MNVCITGGTGFLGTSLTALLVEKGHSVSIFTRSPDKYNSSETTLVSYVSYDELLPVVERSAAVVNLAGENLFDKRWTDEVKSRILKSRVKTTRAVVEAIAEATNKPAVLVSGSGVDYYASHGDEIITEDTPAGDTFLSRVCVQWEEEAAEVLKTGVRLVISRTGVVMGKGGGALDKMTTPFSMFVGGPLGSGKQYFPWVHMADACEAILFAITNEKMDGPFNLAAPNPVTMKEFTKELGNVMNRPSVFRVPEFALRIVVGEGTEALTSSHRIIPQKLLDHGFEFKYPNVHEGLQDILK